MGENEISELFINHVDVCIQILLLQILSPDSGRVTLVVSICFPQMLSLSLNAPKYQSSDLD